MDKERKKYLKKLGSKLIEEKSEQIKEIMKESNPADIGDPMWAKNYKLLNQLEKKYRTNSSEVYSKEREGLDFAKLPIEMDLSKQYTPVRGYYLHCKNCGAFVPMKPEVSMKCFCDNILFDLENKRKYIDLSSVEVVKLIAKVNSKVSSISGYFKKLSNIFKRNRSYHNTSNETTSEVDTVNALVNRLMKEGRSNELESRLQKINIEKLNTLEKESWHHLYGICAFQRKDHREAMERFSEGLKQVPDCQRIRFLLGQEFIFLNQPEKAFLEFDKCTFPEVSREYLMRMSNYAYLFNQYQRGMNYISQLFPYYFKLKILDDHFLYVRGLPFFSTCWQNYAGHCILNNNIDKLNDFFNKVQKECVDYDFDKMSIELKAYCTGNYDPLIELKNKVIKNLEERNLPSGYLRTQAACLTSLVSPNYTESISILNSVQYTDKDHKWLKDAILLAKACVANKFKIIADEDFYKNEFIKKQPLLFEVENAIAFGLLNYQEKLKKLIIPVKLEI